MILSTGLACALLVGCFLLLVILRVPVAFALGIATIPVVAMDLRLSPFIIIDRMFQSYNSFILLAVPFFLLAANLMNSGTITDKLIDLARVLTGWMPGGLGHVNVAVSMLFAGSASRKVWSKHSRMNSSFQSSLTISPLRWMLMKNIDHPIDDVCVSTILTENRHPALKPDRVS